MSNPLPHEHYVATPGDFPIPLNWSYFAQHDVDESRLLLGINEDWQRDVIWALIIGARESRDWIGVVEFGFQRVLDPMYGKYKEKVLGGLGKFVETDGVVSAFKNSSRIESQAARWFLTGAKSRDTRLHNACEQLVYSGNLQTRDIPLVITDDLTLRKTVYFPTSGLINRLARLTLRGQTRS